MILFSFSFTVNLNFFYSSSKLRHPNVILFMGSCMQPNNYMMVTELMPRGSVYDVLHDKNVQLSFKQKMKMVKRKNHSNCYKFLTRFKKRQKMQHLV